MSFAKQAKLEAMATNINDDCCQIAFLSGLIHACGEIDIDGFHLVLITDMDGLYSYVNDIVHSLYGQYLELEICDDFNISKTTYYKITFPDNECFRILLDTGLISRVEGQYKINKSVDDNILKEEHCKKAFIKGAFLGASTSSIKIGENIEERTNTGYHIEFNSHNYEFLLGLSVILTDFNILPKLIKRKNTYVLYLKEVNQISDLLAIVNANTSVLQLNNEIIARELRNKVNRETNCLNANISRTVEASLKQVEAIEKINDIMGIEALDEELQEVAVLRLANPEESLDELLKLSNIKLTRSGLSHRFRKIIKIANEL